MHILYLQFSAHVKLFLGDKHAEVGYSCQESQ